MSKMTRVTVARIVGLVCVLILLLIMDTSGLAKTQDNFQSPIAVDLKGYRKESGITVHVEKAGLQVAWPASGGNSGILILNLEAGRPLIESVGTSTGEKPVQVIARQLDPAALLTIGERTLKEPEGWVIFFDNPPQRPYQTFPLVLKKESVRVSSEGTRTTITIGTVSAGSFHGDMRFTFYRNSPLIHVEYVVTTQENGRAILYDTGLTSASPDWQSVAWKDTGGQVKRVPVDTAYVAQPVKVAGRTVVAEAKTGSLAAFPPPHQFFYPQDEAFNLSFVWYGKSYNTRLDDYGFGIRQSPTGDKRYVPWFNAPPGTKQHLGVFYLVSPGNAEQTLSEVAQYTRGDQFKKLPGYRTYTSHYHIEHTYEFVRRQKEQKTDQVPKELLVPGFVKTFKAHGVDIVHLAEFHEGNTPRQKASERLPLLKTLYDECARLSDEKLLVLPGEEPNVHLGGHWLSLFPKPVYWVLNRSAETPFVEQVAGFGTVYHVGNTDDVLRLMEKENGLMWTAHARIKASVGFPDGYKNRDFFLSDRFLGAAWKAMPADLSVPRLGGRVLVLMDDMANWGLRKYVPSEADLFRMEPDFETYGHLNINYLQLKKLPRFADGWQPVLDSLRQGRFFTSTGEVLIPSFTVGGKGSGETLYVSRKTVTEVKVNLEWTFPLAFAEVISGDGKQVFRQRIDLSETQALGKRTLSIPVDLKGRTWAMMMTSSTTTPPALLRLYLIRHGETEWSLSRQHTSRTDIPLTTRGEEKARELGNVLQNISFTRVLTSPRQRARRTCELAGLGARAEVEPRLVEWDYGDYEGKRSVEIHQEQPGWNLFRDGCPNGETPAHISDRVDNLIAELRVTGGNIALFSHGHLGSVLAARWIGLPVLEAEHFPLATASLSILGDDPNHPDVPIIVQWNKTLP
ncbi:hypothetical protein FGG08_007230 [Glutinoglossum americanum]|uniref:Uncharacterized protein n=1 Tax=Glutinoglossum americanum TaxID=1670608 RepID=A0A9P8HZY1_9PEZI|nr:hypothetical protein FGG08_007230 [Glutinoglossum americanum]